MRQTLATFFAVSALTGLFASDALAWDEDTCSNHSELNPDGTYVEPTYCASATPLEGRHPSINFDHSISHFEFTYLAARCVARGDSNGRKLAAADAATDMSSPACGSGAVDDKAVEDGGYAGQYYYAGYACGYELDEQAATATMPAVPAMDASTEGEDGVLRWKHSDRCRSSRIIEASGLHGHGEFFHYPYWAVSATTNSLSTLRDWAHGTTRTLPDPSDSKSANCDLAASSGCAFSWPLQYLNTHTNPPSWTKLLDVNGQDLCSWSTSSQWVMPSSHPASGGWDTDTGWPYRIGMYLHALGDYYSHSTCQLYSGQPTSDSTMTGAIVVPISDDGPTDHVDYTSRCPADGKSYTVNGQTVTYTQGDCFEACALSAHDNEYGASGDSSAAVQALGAATESGLKAVWDEIARYPYWATQRDVEAASWYRDSIVGSFASSYDPAARQKYVHDVMSNNGAVAVGQTADYPCLCPNGVYDWVEGKLVRTGPRSYTAVPGHCASPTSIVLSTSSSETTTATANITVAAGATVRLYAWAPSRQLNGATETRSVGGSSNWVVANTGVATVNNTYNSSSIGTITGVAHGTTTVQVTRLGMASSRVTITVP